MRCPHCGLELLNLAVHLAEAHPDQPQQETEAEREAREQEAARQAAVAAEIARREAEAAQRKAEARARRQAVEGPQAGGAWPGRTVGNPDHQTAADRRVGWTSRGRPATRSSSIRRGAETSAPRWRAMACPGSDEEHGRMPEARAPIPRPRRGRACGGPWQSARS